MSIEDPFKGLSPFEKTVLLELAKTQAMASAAFQVSCAAPGEKMPPAKEILTKALDDSLTGLLATLKKNKE